ncbi:hypothetical protein pb186bvf_019128 [Paramecium bursaria]
MDMNAGNTSLDGVVSLENKQQYAASYSEEAYKVKPEVQSDDKLTLEESVSETILRDLRMIAYKLKYVLLPKTREDQGKELRNWDLWGPLILCLMLALTLSIRSSSEQRSDVFAIIFVLIWVGAFIVTLNAQLLGGKISFFQSVCVLGYCVFPINLGALIVAFVGYFPIKLVLVLACFGWSTYASIGFMGALVLEERKLLAVYPVFLFYLFLAWFAIRV